MKNKKGFTLVELMVVVAIIAILAAVALPMYSTFKQKSKVGTALKSLEGAKTALQGWYQDKGTFSEIKSVAGSGGAIMAGSKRIGAGLPAIEDMTWSAVAGTSTAIEIDFSWGTGAGCPEDTCNGRWYLTCDSANDKCTVFIQVGTDKDEDPLGLNKGTVP